MPFFFYACFTILLSSHTLFLKAGNSQGMVAKNSGAKSAGAHDKVIEFVAKFGKANVSGWIHRMVVR